MDSQKARDAVRIPLSIIDGLVERRYKKVDALNFVAAICRIEIHCDDDNRKPKIGLNSKD